MCHWLFPFEESGFDPKMMHMLKREMDLPPDIDDEAEATVDGKEAILPEP